MSEERDNTLAIARFEGDRAAVRAEMRAMESPIDASPERIERKMAEREDRMLPAIAGMIGPAIDILGFLV